MMFDLYYRGIKIDETFKDILLLSEISNYSIDEVEVGKLLTCEVKDGTWCKKRTPVGSATDPQFQYLIGNKKYYNARLAYMNKKTQNDSFRSLNTFNKLTYSVKKNKYDYHKGIIVIDGDNNILDGAHRASIVCFTDGCDKKVKVLRVFN